MLNHMRQPFNKLIYEWCYSAFKTLMISISLATTINNLVVSRIYYPNCFTSKQMSFLRAN